MIRHSSRNEDNRSGLLSLLSFMKRGQKRRLQRQDYRISTESALVNTTVEALEDRTLLDASAPEYLFAPDTDPEYMLGYREGAENYEANERWTTTITDGSGLVQGDGTTLTWTIVADGVTIPGDDSIGEPTNGSDLIDFMDDLFGDGGTSVVEDKPWFTFFEEAFNSWGNVSGLTYEYVTYDDGVEISPDNDGILGVRPDIRVGGHLIDGASGILAYNFFPSDGGDMVIDTSDGSYFGDSSNNYLNLFSTIAHEAGHGIGLGHTIPNDATKLMEPFANDVVYSPQFDDILGAQRLYGDLYEGNGGNDTAATATDVGTFVPGDSGSVGDDAVQTTVDLNDTDFLSIDGITDEDYFAFTVEGNMNVSMLLAPLGPTYDVGPQTGTASSFDSSMQNDLGLQILDTDGVTVLATSDTVGLGLSEIVIQVGLPIAGTYYVRIYGNDDAAQFYQLSAQFEEGEGLPQGAIVELRWDTTAFAEEAGTNLLIATLLDPVTRDPVAADGDVTVLIDFSGVGLYGIDFNGPDQIIIADGATEGSITITGIDDLIPEDEEIIFAEIVAVFGSSTIGAVSESGNQKDSTFIFEGVPDEPIDVLPPSRPTVELSISDTTMAENGGSVVLTATMNIPNTDPFFSFFIPLNYSGSATAGVDYTASFIEILPGELSGSITLASIDDLIVEGDETLVVEIDSSNRFIIKDGIQQVSATIIDDDLPYPIVTLTSDVNTIPEYWGIVTYTATLDRIYITDTIIDFSFSSDDAVLGVDYGAWQPQITIPAGQLIGQFQAQAIHDLIQEPQETFTVTVTNVNGFVQDGSESVTTTILDDDLIRPSVTLSASPSSIPEYWGVSTITATLNQTSVLDTTINLGLSGTATQGLDYGAWMTQIVIPAGQLTGQIQVQAMPDIMIDGDETIVVDILSVINGDESGVQQQVITIVDDDLPLITLSTDVTQVDEYWSIANFVATTSAVSTSDILVNVIFFGSATQGVDYGVWESQIVIPAGQLTGQIPIQTIADGIFEPDELVTAAIVSVTNGLEDGNQVASVVIKDQSSPNVVLTSNVRTINEYWGIATFTATQDKVSAVDTIVKLDYSGTAVRGTDYGAWQDQIVIPAGELSAQAQIQAKPDDLIEQSESVKVTVTEIINGKIQGNDQSETVLITNANSGVTTLIDPVSSLNALVISGTSGNDVIRVREFDSALQVSMNNVNMGSYTGIERLVINAGNGNDTVIVEDTVTVNAVISGGKGNDTITGGAGHDIILGDEGNDILGGGIFGRDVIIGGDGGDQINIDPSTSSSSFTDGDLMIAGISRYETEQSNLYAIHTEWISSNPFATRVNNLKNGVGGLPILNSSTVMNDFDLDELFSTPGQDWFLFTPAQDLVTSAGSDQSN